MLVSLMLVKAQFFSNLRSQNFDFAELNKEEFVSALSELTGIKGLKPDPSLEGGGLHQTQRGGFLNIHADFTVHPHKRNWRRRVTVLVYLNDDW